MRAIQFGHNVSPALGMCVWVILLPHSQGKDIDFVHQVVPILKEYCGKCHIGEKKKGGLSFNTRALMVAGGESGKVIHPGKPDLGDFSKRLITDEKMLRMPPEGPRVPPEKVEILKNWIREGAKWESGYSLGGTHYEPPLKLRKIALPQVLEGMQNPIDRLLFQGGSSPVIKTAPDEVFLRRVFLDLIGILPTPQEQNEFLTNTDPQKRTHLVKSLLARNGDYAEHWLSFWNDLLRNDYTGTGFITGGRRQITKWLYDALVSNMPYDQFAGELVAPPTPESAGFSEGIRWRGEVSAGQTVEIQFAQSVGQAFLGINLKCASCHDSFIDRWKLEEAYGMAAIFSDTPLEIHRCDKPIGKKATASWLFPELGNVDPKAPKKVRLEQLAKLLTHPENGRFPRTMVNRFWQRLMGRGIVHPVDGMQNEPSHPDLLDYLAGDFAEHKYDLKRTLFLIATSRAYQAEIVSHPVESPLGINGIRGPIEKRLTAEQFLDGIWQITGTAPQKGDAAINRWNPKKTTGTNKVASKAKWIWSVSDSSQSPAGETIVFRKDWTISQPILDGHAVITCDNSYTLFINQKKVHSGDNWENPGVVSLKNELRPGKNEILILAKNGGAGPNLAGLWMDARVATPRGELFTLESNETWQWSKSLPDKTGKYQIPPSDWKEARMVKQAAVWDSRLAGELASLVNQGTNGNRTMRASLVKRDFFMANLGRPNRDQIVSVRPEELNTLEAIDLSNGQILATLIEQGANSLIAKGHRSSVELVKDLFQLALVRKPTVEEIDLLTEGLGAKPDARSIQDVLWAIIMLPEYQFIR